MTSTGSELAAETPQRCSDAERDQASSVVRAAAAEGRLSLAEFDERLSTIYSARYRHELAAVSADLPTAGPRTGWTAVLSLAWHQLTTDLAGLVGRDGNAMSRRRKVVLALVILAAVVVLVALVTMVVHGLVDDGPEHHEFGGD